MFLQTSLLHFAFSFNLQAQDDKGFEISKNLEIFANVYKTLHQNYVDDVDPGKAMKKAIDAMLASMDPYTNYYAESDMEDVKMQVLGQYGGIGALIQQHGDYIVISEPYENCPAQLAGLRAGDKILSINKEKMKKDLIDRSYSSITGPFDTPPELSDHPEYYLYEDEVKGFNSFCSSGL